MKSLTRTQRLLHGSPATWWASTPAWRLEAVERIADDRLVKGFVRRALEHMARPLPPLPTGPLWDPVVVSDDETVDAEVWDGYDPELDAVEGNLLGYHATPPLLDDAFPPLTARDRARIWRERIRGAVSVLAGREAAAPLDWKCW